VLIDPVFWAAVAGIAIPIIQDTFATSAWGRRYAELGPDQPMLRSLWETRHERSITPESDRKA
jgi:hypothetical protein